MLLCGLLTATGLMVVDELITLLRYCPDCLYQIPMLGPLDPYDAEGIAWLMIIGGLFLGWCAVALQIFTQYGIPLRFRRRNHASTEP